MNTYTSSSNHGRHASGDAYDTGKQPQRMSDVGYGRGYAADDAAHPGAQGVPGDYTQPSRVPGVPSSGGAGKFTENIQTDVHPVDSSPQTSTGVPPSALRGLHFGRKAETRYAGDGASNHTDYAHDAPYGQVRSGDPNARRPVSGPGMKPSMGQRIVGEIEKFAGRLMEDPEMVTLGKQRTSGQLPTNKNLAGAAVQTGPNAKKF